MTSWTHHDPAVRKLIREAQAEAWELGHRTYRRLGPDDCKCAAYDESECGCGLYGTNIITPNPYREVQAGFCGCYTPQECRRLGHDENDEENR